MVINYIIKIEQNEIVTVTVPNGIQRLLGIGNTGAFRILGQFSEGVGQSLAHQFVIIRNQGTPEPLILMVDLASGIRNLHGHEDVKLEPLDIVFVPKSKIAEVNQFVDQYINKVLPFSRNVGVQYTFGEIDDNNP